MEDLSHITIEDLEMMIQMLRLRLVIRKILLRRLNEAIARETWGKDYPQITITKN